MKTSAHRLAKVEEELAEHEALMRAMQRTSQMWVKHGRPDPDAEPWVWKRIAEELFMTPAEVIALQERMLKRNARAGRRQAPYTWRQDIQPNAKHFGLLMHRDKLRNFVHGPAMLREFPGGVLVESMPSHGLVVMRFTYPPSGKLGSQMASSQLLDINQGLLWVAPLTKRALSAATRAGHVTAGM